MAKKKEKDKKKPKAAGKKGEAAKKKKKGGAKKAAKLAPRPVKTGRGASPAEVGAELVALFNDGKFEEIERRLWSPKIVSVEGQGVSLAWHGLQAVRAKNGEWMATHTIHESRAEGPFVGATGFSVRFSMDVSDATSGQRTRMTEIGVYTVERGKIAREEFMYQS